MDFLRFDYSRSFVDAFLLLQLKAPQFIDGVDTKLEQQLFLVQAALCVCVRVLNYVV